MNEENIEKCSMISMCSIMGDFTLYGLRGKVCNMHNIVFLLVRVLYQDIYAGVMGMEECSHHQLYLTIFYFSRNCELVI
jgi:hypothetical protein